LNDHKLEFFGGVVKRKRDPNKFGRLNSGASLYDNIVWNIVLLISITMGFSVHIVDTKA